MSLARLVVTAVVVEQRSKAEVARTYGLSRTWVHELVRRYQAEGDAGLEPRSRRPRSNPARTDRAVEDDIVALRKTLTDQGLDAGAATIAAHLHRRHGTAPSVATIWRILTRRGFVTPQPHKRPKASLIRFEADQPNERWQADTTHWHLADGTDIEILDIIDDHSRLAIVSHAHRVFKAADIVESAETIRVPVQRVAGSGDESERGLGSLRGDQRVDVPAGAVLRPECLVDRSSDIRRGGFHSDGALDTLCSDAKARVPQQLPNHLPSRPHQERM